MGFNLPNPKRKPKKQATMFEGASTEHGDSTSDDAASEEEQKSTALEPELGRAQDHTPQLSFMQLSEMPKQDVERMQQT